MTARERILGMLKGEKIDRIPWCGDLAYWIDYLNDEKIMPEKYLRDQSLEEREILSQGLAAPFHGKGLMELHRDLNVGFYLQGYFPFDTVYDGVEVVTELKGTTRTTTVKTPYGDMQEVWEYVFTTHSWGPRIHMVKDEEDLKKVRYLYEHTFYEPNYKLAEERTQIVGEQGVVLVYMPKCPIMEMIALRAGIESVTYMIMDAEEEWEETIAVMEKKHGEACEIALKAPCECIMIPDNLSSGSIGRNLYRKYAFDYSRKWTDRIRKAGKYSFVHLDGTVNPLLTEVCEAGFDVVEGLTPYPVGDMKYSQMRDIANEKAILWGGIPGGFFTPDYSDEAFDQFVIPLIEEMCRDGRSVLAVGDQVVPGASFERIRRVNELAEKYGYYEK
ncbi:hypothetical protein C3B58_16695 [Lactonifactor longoviformis]|uniref:Uroporphyrinogen decarboxylase (URO-D) n=1 Tax=Lactonifactor longoviformis DSM 17459 TaxID=1122155 RepID=A0A1M4Y1X7_9CLOT|nr:uroporphyrinogen decarboxylase family protein [Lactonifactor longoviformis]POP31381.1 hypothetical protein C3B58_16695 [Lactonifactor longoviformis]SHE99576.1 Uroporphyrinogen decarboxylase (URO-D) [Lactonifactor longoviformis DSM 17459]